MGTTCTRRKNYGILLIEILDSDLDLIIGFRLWIGFVPPSLVRRVSSLVGRTRLRNVSSRASFAPRHLTRWSWTPRATSEFYCTKLAGTLLLLASILTYSSKGNKWRNIAGNLLTNVLTSFHSFIHELNDQRVKLEEVYTGKTQKKTAIFFNVKPTIIKQNNSSSKTGIIESKMGKICKIRIFGKNHKWPYLKAPFSSNLFLLFPPLPESPPRSVPLSDPPWHPQKDPLKILSPSVKAFPASH